MPITYDEKSKQNKYEVPSVEQMRDKVNELRESFCGFLDTINSNEFQGYKITNVYFDSNNLFDLCVRVDKRLEHSKIFHDIDDSNEYRYVAILSYWIVKLHPFYVVAEKKSGNTLSYDFNAINEVFVLYLYMKTVKALHQARGEEITLDKQYIDELKYTLRYRDLNKATMILLYEPKFEKRRIE